MSKLVIDGVARVFPPARPGAELTRALEPIADGVPAEGVEIPETFPEGT